MLSSKKRREYTNVYSVYILYGNIQREIFRPRTFTLDKRKKWWICSKLMIEKWKMGKERVPHIAHAHTRERDQANKYASKHNRNIHRMERNETELDFGLEAKASGLSEKIKTAARVKFAIKTIFDFCNRCCRYTYTSFRLLLSFFYFFCIYLTACMAKWRPNLLLLWKRI